MKTHRISRGLAAAVVCLFAFAVVVYAADSQVGAWKLNLAVTVTTRYVYSKDGKTRTLTTTGTNYQGVKVSNTVVYDKQ